MFSIHSFNVHRVILYSPLKADSFLSYPELKNRPSLAKMLLNCDGVVPCRVFSFTKSCIFENDISPFSSNILAIFCLIKYVPMFSSWDFPDSNTRFAYLNAHHYASLESAHHRFPPHLLFLRNNKEKMPKTTIHSLD